MSYLDLAALEAMPLTHEPYEHLIVKNFIHPSSFEEVIRDFPPILDSGSHPPSELEIKGNFLKLMEMLQGDSFRKIVESKFQLDLAKCPTMYTVRGQVSKRDGGIHTDSKSKIITVLLYMNQAWDADGGRLRLLRSGTNLEDCAAEIPPDGGTLLVFRRCDHSWHGHYPHEGQRRVIQLNWVTGQDIVNREQSRHRWSSRFKKLFGWITKRSA